MENQKLQIKLSLKNKGYKFKPIKLFFLNFTIAPKLYRSENFLD